MCLCASPVRSRPLGLATIAVLLGLLIPGVSHASALTIRPGARTTATVRLAGRAKVLVALTAVRCGSSVVIREGGATVRRRLSPHRSATVDLGWMSTGVHDVILRDRTHSAACHRVWVRAHLEVLRRRSRQQRTVTPVATPPATSPATTATPAPVATAAAAATAGDPLAALPFYVSPWSEAAHAQAQDAAAGDTTDADLLARIADEPEATWLTGGTDDASAVADTLAAARTAGQMPVFVLYDIPGRGCSDESGAASPSAYVQWLDGIASALGSWPAAVIVEPDALPELSCWSASQQTANLALLAGDVRTLAARPDTAVYLDAGNPSWQPVGAIAQRLQAADIAQARGFSLNVSNFQTTSANLAYGDAVSAQVGGKHFVVDTGRNGLGPLTEADGAMVVCNPPGRGLGTDPTADTGEPLVDAYLWVKPPGESDGTCNGGPPSGEFWQSAAIGLVQNASS